MWLAELAHGQTKRQATGNKMELTTHLNHSEWGRISRNGDNEEWELSESYLWPKIGMIEIRFYIMDPDS